MMSEENPVRRSRWRFNPRVVAWLLIIGALFSAFIAIVVLGGKFFTGSMSLTAPGVTYSFGASRLDTSECVVLGELVENVYEPRSYVSNSAHADFLLHQLVTAAEAAAAPITQADVLRGYTTWRPAATELRYNFTLPAARRLAVEVAQRFDTPCLCYAALGIPKNVVFVRTGNIVLYEPFVAGADVRASNVEFKSRFPLARLMSQLLVSKVALSGQPATSEDAPAERFLDTLSDTITVPDRGKIGFITESGTRSELRFEAPVYPCVRYCLQFFAAPKQ